MRNLQQNQVKADPFNYSLPVGMYFQQQIPPPQQGTAVSSWAHHNVLRQQQQQQQDIGPQSLDSQWIQQQQQQQAIIRTDHPAALTRKLSTYGTLPRNRQRRFFLAAQKQQQSSKSSLLLLIVVVVFYKTFTQHQTDKIGLVGRVYSPLFELSYCCIPIFLFYRTAD